MVGKKFKTADQRNESQDKTFSPGNLIKQKCQFERTEQRREGNDKRQIAVGLPIIFHLLPLNVS